MTPGVLGSKQMTAAIAFSLALFSHILNHVVIRLQSALYELEHPRKVMQLDEEARAEDAEDADAGDAKDAEDEKSNPVTPRPGEDDPQPNGTEPTPKDAAEKTSKSTEKVNLRSCN